jgi:phenylpyruvate tautomerase PptA (4-oxalocrotonate tautomerase family)
MPLIRIDLQAGRTPEQVRDLADTVHGALLDHFAAPPGDRYQVITEHPVGHIIAEDTGLGYERTDDVVVVQVFQQGRSQEQKQTLYRVLCERLDAAGLVRPDDLIVSIAENHLEDWSFGRGRAQFRTGGRGSCPGRVPRTRTP